MRVSDAPSLPEVVRSAAFEFGELPALGCAEPGGDDLTYGQLWELVCLGRSTLSSLDLIPGDRVILAAESRPEWAAALFAILGSGLVAVPLTVDTTPQAARAVARHTKAKAVVHSDRARDLTVGVEAAIRVPVQRLFEPDRGLDAVGPSVPDDLALLALTSGSTSQPRIVELTHRNLLANLDSFLRVRSGGPGDTMMSMLPLAHLFGLMVGLLVPLACGSRVILPTALLPNRVLEALRAREITHALAVPALLDCLYREGLRQLAGAGVIESQREHDSPDEVAERVGKHLGEDDLKRIQASLRSQIGPKFHTVIVGGAAVDPAIVAILAALGIRVEVGYGLTEASPVVSLGFANELPVGSVGRPLPGVDVRVDATGEILVRGDNLMRGYSGNPEATEAALKDGWLRTGDRGRLDEDGHLFVTGRLKEAIVTDSGETIYPEEIEPLYESPLFAELCITAVSGKHGNDLPVLFVLPASPDLTDAELEQAFVDLRADVPSRFRVERIIRLAHPLPRTATGKVRRRILAGDLEDREAIA